MRIIKLINISEIIVDRYSISPETLNIVDFIRGGGIVPHEHLKRYSELKQYEFFTVEGGNLLK